MSGTSGGLQASAQIDVHVAKVSNAIALKSLFFVAAIATVAMPRESSADSQAGVAASGARVDFRIVIPAIIRVTTVTQPESIEINDQHIQSGYIDLDAVTAVKLTNNTRSGYQLTARYDATLLSSVEVLVSSKKLTASSGFGSMHVASGLAHEQVVPIGYRMYLARGVQAGQYRWPVALAFSLAVA